MLSSPKTEHRVNLVWPDVAVSTELTKLVIAQTWPTRRSGSLLRTFPAPLYHYLHFDLNGAIQVCFYVCVMLLLTPVGLQTTRNLEVPLRDVHVVVVWNKLQVSRDRPVCNWNVKSNLFPSCWQRHKMQLAITCRKQTFTSKLASYSPMHAACGIITRDSRNCYSAS